MAIEYVDLPINSMVDPSTVSCKRLPEGINHDQPCHDDLVPIDALLCHYYPIIIPIKPHKTI